MKNKITGFYAPLREIMMIMVLLLLVTTVGFSQEEMKKEKFVPSDHLKQITGLTESYGMTPRLKRVHKLSKMLSEDEISYLWDFLNKKHTDDPLDESALNPIKNDVAVALLEQEVVIEEFGAKMMAMFSAKDNDGAFRHDMVWRDYCIQFLGQWYGVCFDESEKVKVLEFIYSSIDSHKGTSIPGSALIAVNLNAERLNAVQRLKLGKKALEVSEKPEYGNLARMSAFHIAAAHCRSSKELRKKLLKALKGSVVKGSSTCVRMAALAAIGTLGVVDEEVKKLIDNYCRSYDIRLRKAAYGARKKLNI